MFLVSLLFSNIYLSHDFYRYPYEAIRVVTSDGYVLLLERIPRYNLLVTLTGASFPFHV